MTGEAAGAERPTWRLVLRNDLTAVGAANESLEAYLGEQQVDPEVVFSAILVLEELVTNVIKYGFDDQGEHEILVEAQLLPGEVVLRVSDEGHEFDPLQAPAPSLEGPIEERPIGGLGLHLVKNLARWLTYERVGGKNVVTVCLASKPN